VDARVLKLVLVFSVENEAVLIEEAHDGRLPAGTSEEVDDDVEEPVLYISSMMNHFNELRGEATQRSYIHFQTLGLAACSSPFLAIYLDKILNLLIRPKGQTIFTR
jgi:hypothetical protein